MNTKRDRGPLQIKLGTFEVAKRDLINLEKIILKRVTPTDHFVELGKGSVYSSTRYIPIFTKPFHSFVLKTTAPGISITFKPRSTMIVVQRAYRTGNALKDLEKIGEELEKYLLSISERPRTDLLRRNTIH